MATIAEKRAWLRDNTTEDIPARGKLRPDLIRLYAQHHPGDESPSAFGDTIADIPDDPDWDLDGDGDLAGADDLEPSVPMQPERAPRTARTARAETRTRSRQTRTDRWVGKLLGGETKPAPKGSKSKPPPRISLEKFTTRIYTSLGRAAQAIAPATGRCIQAQAAMAGVLLEDMAAHTMLDRILQPAAKAEDKLDKGFALIAPPALVFALEMNQSAVESGTRTPQQGMVRQAMIMPMLRESLRVGLEVSEAYADQIKARLETDLVREAEVDKLIALIFGQVDATAEDVPEPAMASA